MLPSMREPTYFILATLLDGPLHGYAIIREAGQLSGGRVRLTAGTLYGALDRLSGDRLVEESGQEVVGGRARRYYRLTSAGTAALREEAARMESAAALVRARTLPTAQAGGA
jgi:DNA-binding PadR family transcriptional regulator